MFARRVLVMCVEYIQLENLTYGMKQPCVCDLKMGGNSKGAFKAVSFVVQGRDGTIGSPVLSFCVGVGLQSGTNAEAGIVKGFKQNVVKSITTSRTLGFRIVGLRSYQVDTATYISKSMLYGTAPANPSTLAFWIIRRSPFNTHAT